MILTTVVGIDQAGGRSAGPPTVVMLAPHGRRSANKSLFEAAGAQLSDVRARLRIERIPRLPVRSKDQIRVARRIASRPGVVAVFWYDPRAKRMCMLLGNQSGVRHMCRKISAVNEEGRNEEVAILLRTAIQTGVQEASPRAAGRRPTANAPRALIAHGGPKCPGQARLEIELAYGAEVYAPPVVSLAHGLRLSLMVNVGRHWAVFLGYRLETLLQGRSGMVSEDLQRHPLDIGTRFRWWFGPVELGARLGLGLTSARFTKHLPETSSNAVQTKNGWLVAVAGYGYLGFRPITRLLVMLAVGVKFYALNERYVDDDGIEILSPWTVQPSALLGVAVDVF